MLHLANPNVSPPGSFRYRIAALADKAPKLAWVGPYHALIDLHNEVKKRCIANGIPFPTVADIEDQICSGLPPGHCVTENNLPTVGPDHFTPLGTFAQGTKTLLGWWLKGKRRVSREESMRRSYICNQCPFHKPLAGCTGCAMKPVRELINQIVGNERYPTDAFLQVCGVCGCSLVAKVRMEKDDLFPHMPQYQKDGLWDKCWLREGNE